MGEDLRLHDKILRDAIEGVGGYVFKTVGDAFCAAFPTARMALEASLKAQLSIRTADWRVPGGISVRMGLHAGEAELRANDYFGPTVNATSRIAGAAHGGQVVLSSVAADLAGRDLPAGLGLKRLGVFRLKDLRDPMEIHQLLHRELPEDFPPLVTPGNRQNNLPSQPTPLLGREEDLGNIVGIVRNSERGLVTVTGPGGVGKSSLCIRAARELLGDFPDGVFLVMLASIGSPEGFPEAVMQTLGAIQASADGPNAIVALESYLGSKRILLVLDNFEQLIPAAPLVARMLSSCPNLSLLVSSREALRLRGEHEYPLAPLRLPARGAREDAQTLRSFAAIRLFEERGRAALPGFTITDDNAYSVAEICARLDGLPLAIELAASRLRLLSPAEILRRLENRFALLAGGARDLPERQQTLRAAIDWSYRLLSRPEQELFTRLAVFAVGFTFEAAESLCSRKGLGGDVLDLLESLVDKSLVQRVDAKTGPRFKMLESIADYARELLQAVVDKDLWLGCFIEWCLALAEESEPAQFRSDALEWAERLAEEHANILRALELLEARREWNEGLRLLAGLGWAWHSSSYNLEALRLFPRFLASAGADASPSARGKVLFYFATALAPLWDLREMRLKRVSLLTESRECFRDSRERRWEALAAGWLSFSLRLVGETRSGLALADESIGIARQTGDPYAIAMCLYLAYASRPREDLEFEEIVEAQKEVMELAGRAREPYLSALAIHGMGDLLRYRGRYAEAITWYDRSLDAPNLTHRAVLELNARTELIDCHLKTGSIDLARARCVEGLALSEAEGLRGYLAQFLDAAGQISSKDGEPRRALRLYAASLALMKSLHESEGTVLPAPSSEIIEESGLPPAMALDEWAKGGVLGWEEALALAMETCRA